MKQDIKENLGIIKDNKSGILEDKEFLYNIVIENGPLGIALTTLDFKFLKVNSTLCSLLGYSREELLSMSIKDISHPDDYKNDFQLFNLLIESKIPSYSMEKRFIKKDNSVLYCKLTANIIKDLDGKPRYGVGYIEDITGQKEAYKKVLEIEQRYRALYNMSGEFIYIFDLDGKFIEANEAAKKRLVYTDEEIKNVNVRDIIAYGGEKILDERLSKLFKGDDLPSAASYKIKNKYGEIIDIESNISLIHKDNKPFAFLGIARDVTERNEIYAELRESKELYQLLVENQTDLIVKLAPDKKYLYVSPSYSELFGKTEAGLLGKPFGAFVNKEDLRKIEGAFKNALQTPYISYTEIREFTTAGLRWIAWSIKSLRDQDGHISSFLALGRDIHDKKTAELALLNSEKKYKEFFDDDVSAIALTDFEGNIFDCNPAFINIFKYSYNELRRMNVVDLYVQKDDRKILIDKLRRDGFVRSYPLKLISKEKKELYMIGNLIAVKDNDGNIISIRTYLFDYTEQKKIKAALEESESRFKDLVNLLPVSVYELDLEGNISFINKTGLNQIGIDEKEFAGGIKLLDFVDDASKDTVAINMDLISKIDEPKTFSTKYIIRRKDGTKYPAMVYSSLIIKDNKPAGIRGIGIDISEEEKLITALQESEEKYRTLFEKDFTAVVIADIKGKILDCNPGFAKLAGLSTTEEAKKLNTKFLYQDPRDRRKIQHLLKKYGEVKDFEFRMKNVKGENLFITGNAAADYNEKGEIKTIRKYLLDNTEKKLAQQKLEDYKNHLEMIVRERTEQLSIELEKQKAAEEKIQRALMKEKELNELKNSFISTASHEFRTPLTSIRLYTDLISMSWTEMKTDELKSYIEHIQSAVKNMTTLIDDVLTISRADTGKLSFNPSEINLRKFSENILEEIKGICSPKHQLNLNYKGRSEIYNLDEKLLRHIFENLLSNSVKYSPDGGNISLEISSEGNFILIGVYDEGMGISPDELKNIFEPFFRTSGSLSIEGTGLGLTIVKRSVELHGGSIEVESEINKGTQFLIRLPVVYGK